MKSVLYLLFVWLLVLSVATASQFVSLNRERIAARSDDRAVWRAVVCTIEHAELKKATPAERTKDVQFWTELLVKKVGTTPCG